MNLTGNFELNTEGTDYFVGDLHGTYDLFMAKLEEINFNPETDRMFSVGDLIDRGPKSLECVKLLEKPWFHCVLGNHEEFLLMGLNGRSEATWFANGGGWILEDFSPIYNLKDEEGIYNRLVKLQKLVDQKCYQFLTVETVYGKVGVIHADSKPNWNDNNEQSRELNLWGRTKITTKNRSRIENIDYVVCGHTPRSKPVRLGNVIYIDTGAYWDQILTVMTIDEIVNVEQI